MWNQLGRFALAVATGEVSKALDVLGEPPERPDAPAARKEGDPPCSAVDGELRCTGHGAEGACVMGKVA